MALLHRAQLHPTKLELLAGWLPSQPWYHGPVPDEVDRVSSFRFDDPEGEVGVETMLVRVGDGPVFQVPLTYRAAPLAGAEQWLIGTTEHSVLGKRWVYDGCGDPVYAATLAATIYAAGRQADEFVDTDGQGTLQQRDAAMTATGAGVAAAVPAVGAVLRVEAADPTIIVTDSVRLTVLRHVGTGRPAGTEPAGAALTGSWTGEAGPLPLAYASTD